MAQFCVLIWYAGKKLYHPPTNQCVIRQLPDEPLKLGSCSKTDIWEYISESTLRVKGTYFCLQAVGVGKPTKLSTICDVLGTSWDIASTSASQTYLYTQLDDGTELGIIVCLDIDSSGNLISNDCKCDFEGTVCDPGNQWFEISDNWDKS